DLTVIRRARAGINPRSPEQSVAAANNGLVVQRPRGADTRREFRPGWLALIRREPIVARIPKSAVEIQSGHRGERTHGRPIERNRDVILRFAHAGLVLVAQAKIDGELR